MSAFVPLEEVAHVALGFKSLQNDFFYLNRATIETYGIEKRYLQPITVFRDLNGATYLQNLSATTWLFECRDTEGDLRGTGALKYIQAMSGRPAAEKKQSGATKTIREVLNAQGGGLWYAPKAKPHHMHLWLRKAFNTVYAPFIFEKPAVVDQRCNYLRPMDGVSWEALGAVLASTLFAYAVEVNGSASMGAGALEAPTSKLRRYPVFDIRNLKPSHSNELVQLGRAVWVNERPIDWSAEGTTPGPHLRSLDEWLLRRSESELTIQEVYDDLRGTCISRIAVADDKVRGKKKHKAENIASVARGIAEAVGPLINGRQFPESFYTPSGEGMPIHVTRGSMRRIHIEPFLNEATIAITDERGKSLFNASLDVSIVEAIVRSVLLGREFFVIPLRREDAATAVSGFLSWFDEIRTKLNEAIDDSALGTGYEDTLRGEVYSRLGVHPLAGERALPHDIHFPVPSS